MALVSAIQDRVSARARRTIEPQISWLLKKPLENPNIISLAAGLVDQKTLPAQAVQKLVTMLFSDEERAKRALQYGTTEGEAALRKTLAQRLESQGLKGPIDPEDIVITNGSQQLLFLATDVLVDPGDIVLVEDPTYFVYMGTLDAVGARTIGIPTDDEGIIPEALEETLQTLKAQGLLPRVKILYVMTYFQNPKGSSHSWPRREKIYEIIERYSTNEHFIFIIEDAAYYELKFEGEEVPFLKTLDPHNERVLLAMTFSKAFAPGFRLGYGYIPTTLTSHILNQKGNHDFGSGNLAQNLICHALQTGIFDQHSAMLRNRYREKRDVMLDVIRQHFPAEVKFLEPKGGLYVWVTMPEGISTAPGSIFFNEALQREVLYVPGCYCYAQEQGRVKPDNQLRLCYAYIQQEPMVEGLKRLADACVAALQKASVSLK